MINDYLRKISSLQLKNTVHAHPNIMIVRSMKQSRRESLEQFMTQEKFKHLRDAYQLLYETALLVNRLSWFSLPMCITIYFYKVLTNTFAFFVSLVTKTPMDSFLVLIWCLFCIGQVTTLAHACQAMNKHVSLNSHFSETPKYSMNLLSAGFNDAWTPS